MATDVTEDPTMVKMAHGSFAWLAHFLCLDGSECMMDGLTRVWENVDLDICYLHAGGGTSSKECVGTQTSLEFRREVIVIL